MAKKSNSGTKSTGPKFDTSFNFGHNVSGSKPKGKRKPPGGGS